MGSPGGSTTALLLAIQWAAIGREVLLIEADPAGGSLSHSLGIQFTPGSASFVASGLPVMGNHLVDHSQDVLFDNLHVMPAPSSPAGARGIVSAFYEHAGDLRAVADSEMAVVVDGGRIDANTVKSPLTTSSAGVLVVFRNDVRLGSVDFLDTAGASDNGYDGPDVLALTIGKSNLKEQEWQERQPGLSLVGSLDLLEDTPDLSSFVLSRGKRKSKRWRSSLTKVGDKLYPYAKPSGSSTERRRSPAREIEPSIAGVAAQAPYSPDAVPMHEAGSVAAGFGRTAKPAGLGHEIVGSGGVEHHAAELTTVAGHGSHQYPQPPPGAWVPPPPDSSQQAQYQPPPPPDSSQQAQYQPLPDASQLRDYQPPPGYLAPEFRSPGVTTDPASQIFEPLTPPPLSPTLPASVTLPESPQIAQAPPVAPEPAASQVTPSLPTPPVLSPEPEDVPVSPAPPGPAVQQPQPSLQIPPVQQVDPGQQGPHAQPVAGVGYSLHEAPAAPSPDQAATAGAAAPGYSLHEASRPTTSRSPVGAVEAQPDLQPSGRFRDWAARLQEFNNETQPSSTRASSTRRA